ncbi:hypothetical protein HDV05_003492 [Chytridiales sp. JEL 0842]|nr:hypothetical protein HDV05_003492 [Chytridiales sp. JEL 0842]
MLGGPAREAPAAVETIISNILEEKHYESCLRTLQPFVSDRVFPKSHILCDLLATIINLNENELSAVLTLDVIRSFKAIIELHSSRSFKDMWNTQKQRPLDPLESIVYMTLEGKSLGSILQEKQYAVIPQILEMISTHNYCHDAAKVGHRLLNLLANLCSLAPKTSSSGLTLSVLGDRTWYELRKLSKAERQSIYEHVSSPHLRLQLLYEDLSSDWNSPPSDKNTAYYLNQPMTLRKIFRGFFHITPSTSSCSDLPVLIYMLRLLLKSYMEISEDGSKGHKDDTKELENLGVYQVEIMQRFQELINKSKKNQEESKGAMNALKMQMFLLQQ